MIITYKCMDIKLVMEQRYNLKKIFNTVGTLQATKTFLRQHLIQQVKMAIFFRSLYLFIKA
uniref:Uncharacterized protein n=1 Tax=Anguilla anguilla TaxID=7936 RepID=A0A0E9UGZ0_ANGAN